MISAHLHGLLHAIDVHESIVPCSTSHASQPSPFAIDWFEHDNHIHEKNKSKCHARSVFTDMFLV